MLIAKDATLVTADWDYEGSDPYEGETVTADAAGHAYTFDGYDFRLTKYAAALNTGDGLFAEDVAKLPQGLSIVSEYGEQLESVDGMIAVSLKLLTTEGSTDEASWQSFVRYKNGQINGLQIWEYVPQKGINILTPFICVTDSGSRTVTLFYAVSKTHAAKHEDIYKNLYLVSAPSDSLNSFSDKEAYLNTDLVRLSIKSNRASSGKSPEKPEGYSPIGHVFRLYNTEFKVTECGYIVNDDSLKMLDKINTLPGGEVFAEAHGSELFDTDTVLAVKMELNESDESVRPLLWTEFNSRRLKSEESGLFALKLKKYVDSTKMDLIAEPADVIIGEDYTLTAYYLIKQNLKNSIVVSRKEYYKNMYLVLDEGNSFRTNTEYVEYQLDNSVKPFTAQE